MGITTDSPGGSTRGARLEGQAQWRVAAPLPPESNALPGSSGHGCWKRLRVVVGDDWAAVALASSSSPA